MVADSISNVLSNCTPSAAKRGVDELPVFTQAGARPPKQQPSADLVDPFRRRLHRPHLLVRAV